MISKPITEIDCTDLVQSQMTIEDMYELDYIYIHFQVGFMLKVNDSQNWYSVINASNQMFQLDDRVELKKTKITPELLDMVKSVIEPLIKRFNENPSFAPASGWEKSKSVPRSGVES